MCLFQGVKLGFKLYPLTTEVTLIFTCISTSAVSQLCKLEPQLLQHILYKFITLTTPTHQQAFNISWPSDQEALVRTESCLKCQKGMFSRPVCTRKLNNGPPGIDQGFLQPATTGAMHGHPPTHTPTHPPTHPYAKMRPNFDSRHWQLKG